MTRDSEAHSRSATNAASRSTQSTCGCSQLLNERTRIVEEIGRIKQAVADADLRTQARGPGVRERDIAHNPGPLAAERCKRDIRANHRRNARTCTRCRMEAEKNTMLVVMQEGATEAQIQAVIDRLVEDGLQRPPLDRRAAHGAGRRRRPRRFDPADLRSDGGRQGSHRIVSPYKLASRISGRAAPSSRSADVEIGGNRVVVMAGPCSVETGTRSSGAEIVADGGAQVIRGGAFKPRSSPYSFQGLGEEGLELMREAADRHGLLVVSEVMDQTQIPLLRAYADILQVGARNMQNYNLLRELGKQRKPVLLKRGISATIEELLLSAEYILSGGNYEVILCERGIRTFETYTRNTMDISAIPVVKKLSHLPMVADPSHGTGRRDKVAPDGARRGGRRRRRPADRSPSRSRSRAERRRAISLSGAVQRTDAAASLDRGGGGTDDSGERDVCLGLMFPTLFSTRGRDPLPCSSCSTPPCNDPRRNQEGDDQEARLGRARRSSTARLREIGGPVCGLTHVRRVAILLDAAFPESFAQTAASSQSQAKQEM